MLIVANFDAIFSSRMSSIAEPTPVARQTKTDVISNVLEVSSGPHCFPAHSIFQTRMIQWDQAIVRVKQVEDFRSALDGPHLFWDKFYVPAQKSLEYELDDVILREQIDRAPAQAKRIRPRGRGSGVGHDAEPDWQQWVMLKFEGELKLLGSG